MAPARLDLCVWSSIRVRLFHFADCSIDFKRIFALSTILQGVLLACGLLELAPS